MTSDGRVSVVGAEREGRPPRRRVVVIEEAKVENTLELEVCLRGPERPTKYGSNRDMLAQLKVPIPGERAWMIYQYATRLAVTGEGRTTFAFTGAEAEELRVQ